MERRLFNTTDSLLFSFSINVKLEPTELNLYLQGMDFFAPVGTRTSTRSGLALKSSKMDTGQTRVSRPATAKPSKAELNPKSQTIKRPQTAPGKWKNATKKIMTKKKVTNAFL